MNSSENIKVNVELELEKESLMGKLAEIQDMAYELWGTASKLISVLKEK